MRIKTKFRLSVECLSTIFFNQLIGTYGLVVKTGCRESGYMGSIPDDCGNPLPRLCHFAWHWASQCTYTRSPLYCCTLYNFFFLGFRQWQSLADRVVNLNTTIQLALFWGTSLGTRARARTHPHVLAWQMGRDYSDCRASELTDWQVSGFWRSVASFIPDFSKTQKKRRPRKRLFSGSCPGLGCKSALELVRKNSIICAGRVFEWAITQPIVRDDPWHHVDKLCICALTLARAFAAAACRAGPRAQPLQVHQHFDGARANGSLLNLFAPPVDLISFTSYGTD